MRNKWNIEKYWEILNELCNKKLLNQWVIIQTMRIDGEITELARISLE